MRTLVLVATLLLPLGLATTARSGESPGDAPSSAAVTHPGPADDSPATGAACSCMGGGPGGQKCCAAAAAVAPAPAEAASGQKSCGCGRKRAGS